MSESKKVLLEFIAMYLFAMTVIVLGLVVFG